MTGRDIVLTDDSIISAPYCDNNQKINGEGIKKNPDLDNPRAGLSLLVRTQCCTDEREMRDSRYKVGGIDIILYGN